MTIEELIKIYAKCVLCSDCPLKKQCPVKWGSTQKCAEYLTSVLEVQ